MKHSKTACCLWSVWASNYMASRGAIVRNLASQFMTLAKEQGATVPLMIGHRTMAISLAFTGDIAESRAHFDNAIALYNPAAHRPLATRFGQDAAVVAMSYRSHAVWYLGYPAAAQADAKQALSDAREIGQATMMFALSLTAATHIFVGNYTTANEQLKELLSLADEKATLMWKGYGMASLGCLCAQTNKASQAVQIITSALAVARSVGAAILMPWNLSNLARAHAELGEFDDALRCIAEAIAAIEGSEERWMEPEVHRIAGEISLRSPERDGAKASAHFERALEVARKQKAKSWELRAAMSLARLWRDRGRRDEARELLAPVYGWFTEGFDTIDLKEAKALLGELAP